MSCVLYVMKYNIVTKPLTCVLNIYSSYDLSEHINISIKSFRSYFVIFFLCKCNVYNYLWLSSKKFNYI